MNPPKMPIHIGDYKRDTGHLRAAEHGAYLLLLFHHWSTGSLPDDDRQLSAIACMTPAEWRKAKPIISKFFGQGWRHGRVEKDLASAIESYEKRAKAGAEGGKAKAKAKQSSSIATAGPEQPLTFNQGTKEEISSLRSESARKRGARLPEDWAPNAADWREATEKLGEHGSVFELKKFRDHWKAAAGQRGVKLDWDATWRNWIRNARGVTNGNGHRGAQQHRSANSDFFAGIASVAADIAGNGQAPGPAHEEIPLGRFNIDG
jgi:uncharacterized protein YdaU (DUF1376 family)